MRKVAIAVAMILGLTVVAVNNSEINAEHIHDYQLVEVQENFCPASTIMKYKCSCGANKDELAAGKHLLCDNTIIEEGTNRTVINACIGGCGYRVIRNY